LIAHVRTALDAFEIRALEIRALEIAHEARAVQVRTAEIRVREHARECADVTQPCIHEHRVAEYRNVQIAALELGIRQIRSLQIRAEQICIREIESREVGTGSFEIGEVPLAAREPLHDELASGRRGEQRRDWESHHGKET
jgi:hypothetical protein